MHKYSGKKWAWAKTIVKLHGPATAEFPNVAINQELEEPLQRNASKCNFFLYINYKYCNKIPAIYLDIKCLASMKN